MIQRDMIAAKGKCKSGADRRTRMLLNGMLGMTRNMPASLLGSFYLKI